MRRHLLAEGFYDSNLHNLKQISRSKSAIKIYSSVYLEKVEKSTQKVITSLCMSYVRKTKFGVKIDVIIKHLRALRIMFRISSKRRRRNLQ